MPLHRIPFSTKPHQLILSSRTIRGTFLRQGYSNEIWQGQPHELSSRHSSIIAQPLVLSAHGEGVSLYVYTSMCKYLCVYYYEHILISENKLSLIVHVSDIPLTRGQPSNKARFPIPHGCPYKRMITEHMYELMRLYAYIYTHITSSVHNNWSSHISDYWAA